MAPVHVGELRSNALERAAGDGRVVADERGAHAQTARRDVAHRCLHVVRNPRHEVGAVAALNVRHLLVNLLGRQPAAEDGGRRQVAALSRVARRHQVLGVKHLLDECRHVDGAVWSVRDGGQRRETRHEEVKTREWHHVDGQLAQIGVELSRETKASRHALVSHI